MVKEVAHCRGHGLGSAQKPQRSKLEFRTPKVQKGSGGSLVQMKSVGFNPYMCSQCLETVAEYPEKKNETKV